MDKKSEQKKDHKSRDDTDIGIHEYGPGNKREQLDGLWGFPTITGGSREQRLTGSNYCKDDHKKYEANKDDPQYQLGEALKKLGNEGTLRENTSQPRIVSTFGGRRGL
jgi:hypothetical protein